MKNTQISAKTREKIMEEISQSLSDLRFYRTNFDKFDADKVLLKIKSSLERKLKKLPIQFKIEEVIYE